VGYGALSAIPINTTSALYNVAVGSLSLNRNTAGSGNVAIGSSAMQSLTSGNLNTAVGYNSLVSCTTGSGNIAIGANSCLFSNGYNNVAVGVDTLRGTSSQGILGGDNTAIGNGALSSVNGGSNTALGFRAGETLPSGNSNIFIGVLSNTTVPVTGSIAIGRNSTITENNQLVIGSLSYPLTGKSILYGNLAITSKTNALSTIGGTSDNWNSNFTFTQSSSANWNTAYNIASAFSTDCSFSVNNTNSPAGPINAGSIIAYNVNNINRGNALNLSTGTFTAPASGIYYISFSGITDSTVSAPHEVLLYKNGAFWPGARSYNSASGYNSINFSTVIPLNTGDTLYVRVNAGAIHNNNGSNFSGYFIRS